MLISTRQFPRTAGTAHPKAQPVQRTGGSQPYRHLTSRNSLLTQSSLDSARHAPVPAPSLDTRPPLPVLATMAQPIPRVPSATPVHPARTGRGARSFPFHPPLSRCSPPTTLLSPAGNFPSLPFNNYQPSTGTLSASPCSPGRVPPCLLRRAATSLPCSLASSQGGGRCVWWLGDSGPRGALLPRQPREPAGSAQIWRPMRRRRRRGSGSDAVPLRTGG
jgi:hypothetical protein